MPLKHLRGFEPLADCTGPLETVYAAAPALWEQVQQLPKNTPVYGFCHGDAFPDNALFGADGTFTLIDFDYAGMGWRAYDLATFIWVHVIEGPGLNWSQGDVFRALLAGYQSVRPLTVAEIEALPAFAGLRQIFLFGTAIQYAPGGGAGWLTPTWFAQMVAFIEACCDEGWLARVGLR